MLPPLALCAFPLNFLDFISSALEESFEHPRRNILFRHWKHINGQLFNRLWWLKKSQIKKALSWGEPGGLSIERGSRWSCTRTDYLWLNKLMIKLIFSTLGPNFLYITSDSSLETWSLNHDRVGEAVQNTHLCATSSPLAPCVADINKGSRLFQPDSDPIILSVFKPEPEPTLQGLCAHRHRGWMEASLNNIPKPTSPMKTFASLTRTHSIGKATVALERTEGGFDGW